MGWTIEKKVPFLAGTLQTGGTMRSEAYKEIQELPTGRLKVLALCKRPCLLRRISDIQLSTRRQDNFLSSRYSVIACIRLETEPELCCRLREVEGCITVMHYITTFRSTTDRLYDGGPIIFFFFHWHYSPLWALACRTMSFHFFLSATNSLHLFTPST